MQQQQPVTCNVSKVDLNWFSRHKGACHTISTVRAMRICDEYVGMARLTSSAVSSLDPREEGKQLMQFVLSLLASPSMHKAANLPNPLPLAILAMNVNSDYLLLFSESVDMLVDIATADLDVVDMATVAAFVHGVATRQIDACNAPSTDAQNHCVMCFSKPWGASQQKRWWEIRSVSCHGSGMPFHEGTVYSMSEEAGKCMVQHGSPILCKATTPSFSAEDMELLKSHFLTVYFQILDCQQKEPADGVSFDGDASPAISDVNTKLNVTQEALKVALQQRDDNAKLVEKVERASSTMSEMHGSYVEALNMNHEKDMVALQQSLDACRKEKSSLELELAERTSTFRQKELELEETVERLKAQLSDRMKTNMQFVATRNGDLDRAKAATKRAEHTTRERDKEIATLRSQLESMKAQLAMKTCLDPQHERVVRVLKDKLASKEETAVKIRIEQQETEERLRAALLELCSANEQVSQLQNELAKKDVQHQETCTDICGTQAQLVKSLSPGQDETVSYDLCRVVQLLKHCGVNGHLDSTNHPSCGKVSSVDRDVEFKCPTSLEMDALTKETVDTASVAFEKVLDLAKMAGYHKLKAAEALSEKKLWQDKVKQMTVHEMLTK